jgi:DNA-binding transcriptional LysR family regulator
MKVNTKHISYFCIICQEGSFTRAAVVCGVRQPSISEGIRHLEEEFGGKLFARTKPVQLTTLGATLYPIFLQINEGAERARRIAIYEAPSPDLSSDIKLSLFST